METNPLIQLLGKQKHISKLAHGYIFSSADSEQLRHDILSLAQSVLCSETKDKLDLPCGHCHNCQVYAANNHPDIKNVGLDNDTLGVDDVREISEFIVKTSQLSGHKLVIIHNAESMTENASNALLKTLEEPTQNSYIWLLVKHKSSLMATILSRCQFIDVPSLSKADVKAQFSEVPDYLIGFANGAVSNLTKWQQNEVEDFEQIYRCFVAWLKFQQPDFELIKLVEADALYIKFLLYLFERRIRQLVLKAEFTSKGQQALIVLNQYKQSVQLIKGQNQKLALTSLLVELATLIK